MGTNAPLEPARHYYLKLQVLVGRDLKDHLLPTLPATGTAAPHQLRLLRAPSILALSTSRDGAPQLPWAASASPPSE